MAELSILTDEQIIAVLKNTVGLIKYPGGLPTITGARAIRQGDMIAKRTSDDKCLVAKLTELSATEAIGQTVLSVKDAHPFEVGDLITVDAETTKTITAIDYVLNTITVDDDMAAESVADDPVFGEAAGTDQAVGVALSAVRDSAAGRIAAKTDELTPPHTVVFGDIAITGVFKLTALRNFRVGGLAELDLAGLENEENDTYIVSTPSAHYSL